MERNELEKIRIEKIERMRAGGLEPYPTRSELTHSIGEATRLFEAAEKNGGDPVQVTVGGRMRSSRLMGKLAFSPHRGRFRAAAALPARQRAGRRGDGALQKRL